MSRIAYVNGRYLPHRAAQVHVEDRGYQFADGVYEVCEVRGRAPGRRAPPHGAARALAQRAAHRACRCRATRSASCCARPCARNRVRDGIVYLQVTRGVARRDHAFPAAGHAAEHRGHGEELRPRASWSRAPPRASRSSPCRTTAGRASTSSRCRCCPTCSPSRRRASRAPRKPGSSTRTGFVTEGSSINAWIVTRDGTVVTRPAEFGILRGITRTVVLEVIADARAQARGAAVHGRGGLRGARSLRHLGEPARHAGGADRRQAGRQRRARACRERAAARFSRARRDRLTKQVMARKHNAVIGAQTCACAVPWRDI